jgi:hypothetical protein
MKIKNRIISTVMALTLCATCVLSVLSFASTASAATYSQGKATIPWYYQGSSDESGFSVSNITDSSINVIITLYNYNGTMLIDDGSSSAGFLRGSSINNYSDNNTDSTVTFTLDAHSTGNFTLSVYSTIHNGYGIIQWNQSGTALQGLVVSGTQIFHQSSSSQVRTPISINNSMPF